MKKNTYSLILSERGEEQVVFISSDLKEITEKEYILRKACRHIDPEGAELDCFIRSAEEADRISKAHAFYNSLTAEEKSDFIVVDGRTYVRKIWERNHPDGK